MDFEILNKCKKLERVKLKNRDKLLVKMIKSQLEDDWRGSLLKTLNKILKKYRKLKL